MQDFGSFIKDCRTRAGLSQKDLADACELSDTTISKIENDLWKAPNWENLCKIAKALKFHVFEILLAAGYITENDIHPEMRLRGLDELSNNEIETVQLFIDFLNTRRISKLVKGADDNAF